jgi:hypothetical protein
MFYEKQLKRIRYDFVEKMEGLIFGIAVGDALGTPFNDTAPGGKLFFDGKEIENIDRLYMTDIGFRNMWPIETTLALNSCKALIDIHEHDNTLKETINSPLVESIFLKYISDFPESLIVTSDKNRDLYRIKSHHNLFMILAPIAPFSVRCGLDVQQTIELSYKVCCIFTKTKSKIFPALEFVLVLKGIFSHNNLIPETLKDIEHWADKNDKADGFKDYLNLRQLSLDTIEKNSDLWAWKYINESILGFIPGGRWADIQGFENAIIKIVNTSLNRSRTTAIAGAILGATRGKSKIPLKFSANIRGDSFLHDLIENFTKVFCNTNNTKKYDQTFFTPDSGTEDATDTQGPYLMYDSNEKIGCAFYTVVTKNDSLNEKYPDGFKAFAIRHSARCNDKITVACDMGSDVNYMVSDLKDCGMDFGEDFCVFDAAEKSFTFGIGNQESLENVSIDLGIEWLKAHFSSENGVEIWYNEIQDTTKIPERDIEIDYEAYREMCKEYNNLLVYGDLNDDLVFIDMKDALDNAQIHESFNKNISYREFYEVCPDACHVFLERMRDCSSTLYDIKVPSNRDMDAENFFKSLFESWFENHRDEFIDEVQDEYGLDLNQKDQAINFYIHYLDDRLPLPGEIIEMPDDDCNYEWLMFPHRMENWVPLKIQDMFGTVASGMVSGDFLLFEISRENEIVTEFERHGFHCIRDDKLVNKACGF